MLEVDEGSDVVAVSIPRLRGKGLAENGPAHADLRAGGTQHLHCDWRPQNTTSLFGMIAAFCIAHPSCLNLIGA
jgi:hypothetical protein